MQFVLMIAGAAVLNAISQTALRIGARQSSGGTNFAFFRTLALNPAIWIGVFLFIVSLCIYMTVLQNVDVLVAFPAMGATHIFVSFLSYFVLRERFNAWRVAGNGMILSGFVILAVGSD
ncbi:MAG: hypothetical protein KGZ68_04540 [Dechloromonas sp.]|nr:hypothetical protein [Dechloromonas sp.]